MPFFNQKQKNFLLEIAAEQNENDWKNIPHYSVLAEERENKKLAGIAGVTIRYFLFPSLFIAVKKESRNKGTASRLLSKVLEEWKLPLFLTFYSKKGFLQDFYKKFGFKKIIGWRGNRVLCIRL